MFERELCFFMKMEEFRVFETAYGKIDEFYIPYDPEMDEPLYNHGFGYDAESIFDIWDMNNFYTNKQVELLDGKTLYFDDEEIVFAVFLEGDVSAAMEEVMQKVGHFLPSDFDFKSHIGYFSSEEA